MTLRHLGMVVVCCLVLAACGGGASPGSSTTAPPATTSASTTTTGAPATTSAPTTTGAPTTTALSDLHPAWPVSWAALWPHDGASAPYVARDAFDQQIETAVGMDYGIDWDGGTWDRIWIGSPDPAELGVAFYLQRPAPWVVVLWGAHTYNGDFTMTERCDPPITLDLLGLPEEVASGETTLVIEGPGDFTDEGPYTFTLSFVGFEDVTVAAGDFANTAHLHLRAEEPGGFVAETDLWIDAEQALVRLEPAHVFSSLELAGAWSG
jgi:hypothetical protein